MHNYKLHKAVSLLYLPVSASHVNFCHIVDQEGIHLASGSLICYPELIYLFAGWLLAFPSLYPLYHFQLPWTGINKLPVCGAISFLAHFCSFKKDLFLTLFKFFITQIDTIRVVLLSSLHSPETASMGTCWSLSNVDVKRVIFSPTLSSS